MLFPFQMSGAASNRPRAARLFEIVLSVRDDTDSIEGTACVTANTLVQHPAIRCSEQLRYGVRAAIPGWAVVLIHMPLFSHLLSGMLASKRLHGWIYRFNVFHRSCCAPHKQNPIS